MIKPIKELYNSSKKDKLYLKEIYDADKDIAPSWYSSDNDKVIFATVYYGWLVGKYGNDWKLHLQK